MYTTVANAQTELHTRKQLQTQVEAWWKKENIPLLPLPLDLSLGILARQVATARYEDLLFKKQAQQAGLTPMWLENTRDLFTSKSSYKRTLLQPMFCAGRHGRGLKLRKQTLADPNKWQNQPLAEIAQGAVVETLHAHQARILGQVLRIDGGAWAQALSQGKGARGYYRYYLSLFLAHGVLFEDYDSGESDQSGLSNFKEQIFAPAQAELKQRFGAAPLIVPLPWWPELAYYPLDNTWPEHGII